MIIVAPLIIASFTKLFPLYVFPFKETKRSPFFMSLEFKHIFFIFLFLNDISKIVLDI